MDNIILRKTLSLVWRLLIIYSVYVLLRGHNEPGGGFIGGLLLALGVLLRGYISKEMELERKLIKWFPQVLGCILGGVLVVVVLPALMGLNVFKGVWSDVWVPIAGKFSSVLVFDIGVYFIVAVSAVYAHTCISPKGGSL